MGAALTIGALIGIVIAGILGGIVIWIVSRLGLGLRVSGFGAAFIAAVVIAVVGFLVDALLRALGLPDFGGIVGFVEQLVISAVVLMLAGAVLPGLSVRGFTGALIASLAISAVTWVLAFVVAAAGLGAMMTRL